MFSATSVLFRALEPSQKRAASVDPGMSKFCDDAAEDDEEDIRRFTPGEGSSSSVRPYSLRSPSSTRGARNMSVDYNSLQRHEPYSHHEQLHELPPLPPYSPPLSTPVLTPGTLTPSSSSPERPSQSPAPSSRHLDTRATVHESPAQTLQDLRDALRADLSGDTRSRFNVRDVFLLCKIDDFYRFFNWVRIASRRPYFVFI